MSPHPVCPPVPAELREAVEEVLPDLERDGVQVFYLSWESPTPGVEALLPAIEAAPEEPPPARHRAGVTGDSRAMYIYTSGTTGEPGPARAGGLRVGGLEGALSRPDRGGSTWARCLPCPPGQVSMGRLEESWGLTIMAPPGPGVSWLCPHGQPPGVWGVFLQP